MVDDERYEDVPATEARITKTPDWDFEPADPVRGVLDEPRGDWDEDGFHLRFSVGEGDHEIDARVYAVATAKELLDAVEPLREWVAEHDRERAAYDRATPEERAAVLGIEADDDAS